MILSIDLGTHFGWAAITDDGEPYQSGHIRIKFKEAGQRYAIFEENLVGLLNRFDVNLIVYEKVRRHRGAAAAHVYGGLEAILLMVAYNAQIPVQFYEVGTIKKTVTGNGRAGKDEVIAAVINSLDLGLKTLNDNEADALAIGLTHKELSDEPGDEEKS